MTSLALLFALTNCDKKKDEMPAESAMTQEEAPAADTSAVDSSESSDASTTDDSQK